MPVPSYDVYLTGMKDIGPSGQMRTIAAIASRCRLSAATVAAAIDVGAPCRLAERLPGGEADALVAAVQALGASVRAVPAGTPVEASSEQSRPDHEGQKDRRVTLKSADAHTPLVDIAEPIEFAEPGPDGRTGVRGQDTIRCPVHGLVYNRRQSSGCIRCLAPARAQARKFEEQSSPVRLFGGDSGEGPSDVGTARRAFWVLGAMLLLGFIPAAIYARVGNHREVVALRGLQAELSASAATKESLARFDEIDAAVGTAHVRGAAKTLLIWVAVSGAGGLAWSRFARRRA